MNSIKIEFVSILTQLMLIMLFKITGLIFFVILLCFGIASAEFDDSSLAVSLRKQTPARRCIVPASNNGEDDSPAILAAFEKCRTNALIVFQNTTYHIGTVMKVTDLENVNIEIHGTLLWSTDIQYWLANSLPIGPGKDQESYPPAAFQNQTTAFILGGKQIGRAHV